METLKQLGKACKLWRIERGYRQSDIAKELNVSQSTISWFESGRANNAVILIWYIKHGFPVEEFARGGSYV